MSKGCWKVDDNDEAIYIDVDVESDEENDDTKTYSGWSELPDLLLEKIFSMLTLRQRYYASLVCYSWYRAFHLPAVWSKFSLRDTTLTRGKFNYYCGWQYVLDHYRTSICLSKIGRHIRHLTLEPMLNFYNLYEFMNMLSWYIEQSIRTSNYQTDREKTVSSTEQFNRVGVHIKSLKFTFLCDMASRTETERLRLFGTGGKLLEALKRLMGNLQEMKRLELIDLLLDRNEAQHLLDEVCSVTCTTLKILVLINPTKFYCPLLHIGVFLNLNTLIISPQNINDDIVELLGYTRLRHLHLIQNRYTPTDLSLRSISAKVWANCRLNNPFLAVHLELESHKNKELILQDGAPVHTILFESPFNRIQPDIIMYAVQMYRNTLRTFGHKMLPRFHQPKSFNERIDTHLMYLCRQAPYINTLIIREKVSTATVLLIAYTAKHLRRFYVRRNAVILRSDWLKLTDWNDEFFQWLHVSSRSYTQVEIEVSQLLGYKWNMLTDKEFININVDVHAKGY